MKTKLIQLVLLAVACCSFYFCYEIGNSYERGYFGNTLDKAEIGGSSFRSYPIESGWDGGALGMGIICASSLLGIVLLETKR